MDSKSLNQYCKKLATEYYMDSDTIEEAKKLWFQIIHIPASQSKFQNTKSVSIITHDSLASLVAWIKSH